MGIFYCYSFPGLSAGFLGGFVERMGPSRSGLLSAMFLALGMVGPLCHIGEEHTSAVSVLRI